MQQIRQGDEQGNNLPPEQMQGGGEAAAVPEVQTLSDQ